ncbi:MAG: Gfo/Idh/MocA family oxidoreductase [Acidobacteriota bacterium]
MANRQVKWGVLGAAKIARAVAPAICDSQVAEAYAVASRARAKARSFAAEFGFGRSYSRYEALLADPAIEAVYIPLPNWLHAEWTIKSLKAGKHVLCEKPIGLNAAECRKMIAASRTSNRLLMEAFMYRFHPQTCRLLQILDSGAIGQVRVVRASFGFTLAENSKNVRLQERAGGGCLMDVGCYCVNLARTVFGGEPIAVRGSSSKGNRSPVDTMFAGILEFPGGGMALFNSSFCTALDTSVEIVGSRGRIQLPVPWKPGAKTAEFFVESDGTRRRVAVRNGGGIYHLEIDHFSRCILGNQQPHLTLEDTLNNMIVIDTLAKSAQSGRRERIPGV